MTRPSKLSLALLCALAGAVVLIGGSPAVSQRQTRSPVVRPPVVRDRNSEEQPPDPYANVAVLVEAFVVQVDLSALYDMGVSPLGQQPHAVSVEDLLECLKDPDKAIVLTGAKTMGSHRHLKGQTRQEETTYRPRTKVINTSQGPRDTVEYRPYENGQSFQAEPMILSENAVHLRYGFSYSGLRGEQQANSEVPPNNVSWSWEGMVSVTAGEPAIVGASQDQNNAVFLILTAHIANRT